MRLVQPLSSADVTRALSPKQCRGSSGTLRESSWQPLDSTAREVQNPLKPTGTIRVGASGDQRGETI